MSGGSLTGSWSGSLGGCLEEVWQEVWRDGWQLVLLGTHNGWHKQCRAVQYYTVQCSALQCTVVYYNVWSSVELCSAVQCNVIKYPMQCSAMLGRLTQARTWQMWAGYTECKARGRHCTVMHCTSLHFTALHCTPLQRTTLYCITLYCTALRGSIRIVSLLGSIKLHFNVVGLRIDVSLWLRAHQVSGEYDVVLSWMGLWSILSG